ncbi:metallophosphoesterase family protein [candidate division WOR-3 bacterium]|nr:metallophosphoesterase family protein [candidate division WOR-3 bacterium]
MKSRYIFIGDIHGCFTELTRLLDIIRPTASDEVVTVGNLVGKGPDTTKVAMYWIGTGFKAVLGNMDFAFLEWLDGRFEVDPGLERDWLESLADYGVLTGYLKSLPLYLDYPEIGVSVVHGGLYPGMKITADEIEAHKEIIALRYLRKDDEGSWIRVPYGKRREGDRFWAELWTGPRTIIYGHTPQKIGNPKVDKRAIGIDTGCVFGGFLTAAIYTPDKKYWDFQMVKAEKAYSPWPK